MIKRRFFGIFGKIFIYTLLILLFVIGGMFLLFLNQIQSAITLTQQRQFSETITGFVEQAQWKSVEETILLVEDFSRWNASFEMSLLGADREVLFQTDGFVNNVGINFVSNESLEIVSGNIGDLDVQRFQVMNQIAFLPLENGLHLQVDGLLSGTSMYREILGGAAWIFVGITIVSLLAAFLFARRIAKPIQGLSYSTRMMSQFLPARPPKERGDEIGQLSKDVYDMYNRLISEIERVKLMEENQRYFFSAASHELKTPITAVGGIFEGMLSDVITPEEYPAYLREGIKLVKEQTKLVSEILELVKLSGNLPYLEKEPINLYHCVDNALKQLSTFIESKGQMLTINVADDIVCKLNSGMFSKVLSNVLSNATQNSPMGVQIYITAKCERGIICLTVWNEGAEIPENIMPNIYEPFYRADEARTAGEGRSGLGLAIVKKALDLMGIAFEIKNTDGGVLFQMNIPVE